MARTPKMTQLKEMVLSRLKLNKWTNVKDVYMDAQGDRQALKMLEKMGYVEYDKINDLYKKIKQYDK